MTKVKTNLLMKTLDTELPPQNRTEANYWKAAYFQQVAETRKANLGVQRLSRRVERMKDTWVPPPKSSQWSLPKVTTNNLHRKHNGSGNPLPAAASHVNYGD